jgi:transcriptional regulator with XRE-family HTH domain
LCGWQTKSEGWSLLENDLDATVRRGDGATTLTVRITVEIDNDNLKNYTESHRASVIQEMAMVNSTASAIVRALAAAGISQRDLAKATDISQPTLSRIMSGHRTAKMNEVLAIANATGCTVAELTNSSTVAGRVQCAARCTNGATMQQMREALLHFLELDAYLDDQGIIAPAA